MKVRGDFLGPPRSTDKTTLIIKVSKGAKITRKGQDRQSNTHLPSNSSKHSTITARCTVTRAFQEFWERAQGKD